MKLDSALERHGCGFASVDYDAVVGRGSDGSDTWPELAREECVPGRKAVRGVERVRDEEVVELGTGIIADVWSGLAIGAVGVVGGGKTGGRHKGVEGSLAQPAGRGGVENSGRGGGREKVAVGGEDVAEVGVDVGTVEGEEAGWG